jgi:hypothetical protein
METRVRENALTSMVAPLREGLSVSLQVKRS